MGDILALKIQFSGIMLKTPTEWKKQELQHYWRSMTKTQVGVLINMFKLQLLLVLMGKMLF